MEGSLIWVILLVALAVLFVRTAVSETGDGWLRMTHARVRAWLTGQSFDDVLWALQQRELTEVRTYKEVEETAEQRHAVTKALPEKEVSETLSESKRRSVSQMAKNLGFELSYLSPTNEKQTKVSE